MRISSLQIFDIARNSMAKVNEGVVQTQEQMSTGKRVLTPADDPVASTKILQLTDELSNIGQYLKNIDIAENNIGLEESIMDNVVGVVHRMQEIAVAAGNTASLTDNEYRAFAEEVSARLDELVNLLNTQNANGDYIFGGYNSTTQPFVGDAASGFQYQGNDGQQFVKIANNTQVAATDSGKSVFLDTKSASNTVQTSASSSNTANPPGQISIGQVVEQADYDDFYPEDIVITFNAESNLTPPVKNFTAVARSTGRVIVANQAYVPGEEIQLKGVSFRITGSPASGAPASEATRLFGADVVPTFPVNFAAPNNESFTVTVGGRTERLVLDANITNVADMVATLNSSANGNAGRLANLGITLDAQGFHMPLGVNITIANGTANTDAVLGLNSTAGTTSTDGRRAQAGDQFFIESSEKQGILTTLARFKNAMESFDGSQEGKEAMSAIVASTLSNLANGLTSVVDVQAKIGARLNTLESTRNLHLDTQLVSKEVMSDLRDLDYAEAATRLSQQTLILQAAQQSFIRVSQLSLFDRL
jgi:flagellar hook-associated protein 3 FlgL